MNRMKFEEIKHNAAKEVFDGTEYNWWDMLDNTEDADRNAPTTEDEQKIYWTTYFTDSLEANRWSDSH